MRILMLGWEFPPSTQPIPGVQYQEYAVAGTRYGGILPMMVRKLAGA